MVLAAFLASSTLLLPSDYLNCYSHLYPTLCYVVSWVVVNFVEAAAAMDRRHDGPEVAEGHNQETVMVATSMVHLSKETVVNSDIDLLVGVVVVDSRRENPVAVAAAVNLDSTCLVAVVLGGTAVTVAVH
jgi:hypothetical protein